MALGASYLAGLATGFWPDTEELIQRYKINHHIIPQISCKKRETLYLGWQKVVSRVRDWEKE